MVLPISGGNGPLGRHHPVDGPQKDSRVIVEVSVHLLLAFMNSIQAIYNFESLGTKVDFSLVKLEIQKTPQFDDHGGDRGPMLTSFCKYQGDQNPDTDSNPHHWDIGLLVSGVDFWAMSGGKKSYLTMGLATVTGICTKK